MIFDFYPCVDAGPDSDPDPAYYQFVLNPGRTEARKTLGRLGNGCICMASWLLVRLRVLVITINRVIQMVMVCLRSFRWLNYTYVLKGGLACAVNGIVEEREVVFGD